jgi:hypothetical protein
MSNWFARAVERIGRTRHPNLVTLVGACRAARAVVYELVLGGSLEERLDPGGGSGSAAPPLPWHAWCSVAYGACSALAFLHSTLPRPTVHGDVRAANIPVLEDNASHEWSCKLVGLDARARGGARAAPPQRRGWVVRGPVVPRCDGGAKPAPRRVRARRGPPPAGDRETGVPGEEGGAGGRGRQGVVAGGGGRVADRARQGGALLELRCCGVDVEAEQRLRLPAALLLEEARGVLEAAVSAKPSRSPSSLSESDSAPSYFLCPILKEVMRDPQISGDGFTYEAEAIREWLRSGQGQRRHAHHSQADEILGPEEDFAPAPRRGWPLKEGASSKEAAGA